MVGMLKEEKSDEVDEKDQRSVFAKSKIKFQDKN